MRIAIGSDHRGPRPRRALSLSCTSWVTRSTTPARTAAIVWTIPISLSRWPARSVKDAPRAAF